MTRMTSDELQKYRDISLHTVIGLTNDGRRRMIRCPFHDDGTASLAIYPNNGYHCFGCGAHGKNAVDFVKNLGCTFPQALEELNKYL